MSFALELNREQAFDRILREEGLDRLLQRRDLCELATTPAGGWGQGFQRRLRLGQALAQPAACGCRKGFGTHDQDSFGPVN